MKCFIYWTADLKSSELDHRSCERNLSNCVQKPEKVRTSTGFGPVTLRSVSLSVSLHVCGFIVSATGFIAQLVRASHRCREVTGSNPVEVLTFSGFYTQLCKLRSQLLTWFLSILRKYPNIGRRFRNNLQESWTYLGWREVPRTETLWTPTRAISLIWKYTELNSP